MTQLIYNVKYYISEEKTVKGLGKWLKAVMQE